MDPEVRGSWIFRNVADYYVFTPLRKPEDLTSLEIQLQHPKKVGGLERWNLKHSWSLSPVFFFRCTVHFDTYKVHTPTNALYIKLDKSAFVGV